MKKLNLLKEQSIDLLVIEGACLQSQDNEDNYVLVFEGHQKRIMSARMTKNVLLKLKCNIDLYFDEKKE